MNKLEVGQELVFVAKSYTNAARTYKGPVKGVVTKIGKKYFEVEGTSNKYIFFRCRFFLKDLSHDGGNYSSEWQGYINEKEIMDELELKKLIPVVQQSITKLNLEQVKEIETLIKSFIS